MLASQARDGTPPKKFLEKALPVVQTGLEVTIAGMGIAQMFLPPLVAVTQVLSAVNQFLQKVEVNTTNRASLRNLIKGCENLSNQLADCAVRLSQDGADAQLKVELKQRLDTLAAFLEKIRNALRLDDSIVSATKQWDRLAKPIVALTWFKETNNAYAIDKKIRGFWEEYRQMMLDVTTVTGLFTTAKVTELNVFLRELEESQAAAWEQVSAELAKIHKNSDELLKQTAVIVQEEGKQTEMLSYIINRLEEQESHRAAKREGTSSGRSDMRLNTGSRANSQDSDTFVVDAMDDAVEGIPRSVFVNALYLIDFKHCSFVAKDVRDAPQALQASSARRWQAVLGRWQGIDIMVKLTQPDALNEKAEEERQESAVLTSFNELYIWSMLHHPCIHRLYGIGTIPGTSISFAAAEVINFDLMSYLEKHPDLTLVQKVRLMTDVARGMKLLHDKEFVHTNLKPKNILVSDNGNAMISDFSLARPFSEAADLSAEDGSRLLSLAYTSPERIEQWKSVKGLCSSSDMRSGIFPSDDVFSFGIVCAAIWLPKQDPPPLESNPSYPDPPYPHEFDYDVAIDICDYNYRPDTPKGDANELKDMPKLLLDLIRKCWAKETEETCRPTFAAIVESLEAILGVLEYGKARERSNKAEKNQKEKELEKFIGFLRKEIVS